MPYDYIAKAYGLTFRAGERIKHQVTGREGTVLRGRASNHYLRVRFDGDRYASNVHPGEALKQSS